MQRGGPDSRTDKQINNMRRYFPVAVVAFLTSRGVAAQSDNGDEFSNNLFTDLAPLVHHPAP